MDESHKQSELSNIQGSPNNPIDTDSPQFLSLEEVAVELCTTLAFVDDLIERNILNYVCLGDITLVAKEDLDNYKSISHVSNRERYQIIRRNEEVSLCWPALIEEDDKRPYEPLFDQSNE